MKKPFKLRSGNTSSFKNLGPSPAKQIDLKDINKENFKKFQAQKNKGKEFVKNLKNKGDLATTKMATDYNYENKKARNQKLLPDKQLKKKVRKKAIKKVAGKVASRAIPGAGWILAATDAYGIGKKMYKGASFKDAAKEQFLGIKPKKKK